MAESEMAAVKVEIFPDRALAVQGIELRHHPHEATGLSGMRHHVHAGNRHVTAGREGARGADTDGCGFAGAIRTEQPEQLAARNGEIDSLHRLNRRLAGIGLDQFLNVDNQICWCAHGSPRSSKVVVPQTVDISLPNPAESDKELRFKIR